MEIELNTIYGFQVGFEIADSNLANSIGFNWIVSIDLGVLRLLISKPTPE